MSRDSHATEQPSGTPLNAPESASNPTVGAERGPRGPFGPQGGAQSLPQPRGGTRQPPQPPGSPQTGAGGLGVAAPDVQHLARRLGRLRDQLAVISTHEPTAQELADQDAADKIMAQRIHCARPGVPLHDVFAVLEALRAAQALERTGCPDPIECDHETALGQAEAALARLHEGEEPYTEPAVELTNGQWLYAFNRFDPARRLQVIGDMRREVQRGSNCFLMDHESRLDDDRRTRAALVRVREELARWKRNTIGSQTMRALDDIDRALQEPGPAAADTAVPLVQVGWYCWRGEGHLAERACRSDNVPVYVPAEWATEMGAEIRRLGEDYDWPDESGQEIVVVRHRGRGLVVESAPEHARIPLARLVDRAWGLGLASADRIVLAEQVLYQVVGYNPATASLEVTLVKDWRPAAGTGGYEGPSIAECAANDRNYDVEQEG